MKTWSVKNGELLSKFASAKPPWIYTWGVSFNPDGTLLAFNHESCTTVDLWDVANQKEYMVLPNSICDKCLGVAFSPDGKLVASCGVYDIAAGELLFELEGAESANFSIVSSVAFSPNGQILGSAGSDRILLWDVTTGKVLAELPGSKDIAFSPDGHLIATGGDVLRLWGVPGQ